MTTLRVRAVPVGAALQLTRRALALGSRFSAGELLEIMGDWWSGKPASPLGRATHRGAYLADWPGDQAHPFTFALRILEKLGLT